jgi:tetratricopeptide (TPR) repeat protein
MTPTGRSKPAARVSRKPKPKSKSKQRAAGAKSAPRGAAKAKPKTKTRVKPRAAAKPVPRVRAKPAKAAPRKAAPRPAAALAAPLVPDPAVEIYESGIRAMFRQKWGEAARLFRRVIDGRDGAEADLQERALQQLHICEDQLAGERARAEEDPFLLAVVRKNSGEYEEALALCVRGGRQSKDERFAYLAASIHALRDEGEEAARFLELAIDLNPKNRVHAFHDPDFQTLRERGALDRIFRG